MEYKLNFNIKMEDYKAFNFDYLFRRKKLFVILFICLLLILAIEILSFKDLTGLISNIIPLFFLLGFYILYFSIIVPKRIKKTYKSNNLLQEKQELTLTETGISEKTSRSFCNYYLDDFKKIIFGKKVISIYIAAGNAIIIPRHCFSTKDEEAKIERFIKTYYIKKK